MPDNQESMIFLLRQLARKTDHRELNLPEAVIQKILTAYPHDHLQQWILEDHTLTTHEQEQIFGDQLPSGLLLELI
jgi:hypothetical protein